MADAGARGHNAEVVERGLAPLQEGVPFHVAFVFAVHVHLESARVAEFVDHHRVVDHEVDRVQRVDLFGVAAKGHDAVAHRGKVNNGRNAGEILHQHAGRAIGDLARVLATVVAPFGKRLDVVDGDGLAVFKTQHVLQNDFQRGGQAGEVTEACGLRGRNGVIGDGLVADCERFAGFGGVLANGDGHVGWFPSYDGFALVND